jgi:filamentous hemagglutinin family protein
MIRQWDFHSPLNGSNDGQSLCFIDKKTHDSSVINYGLFCCLVDGLNGESKGRGLTRWHRSRKGAEALSGTVILGICTAWTIGYQPQAIAQLIPDQSLGADASVVRSNLEVRIQGQADHGRAQQGQPQTIDLIEGGLRQNRNQIHSFQDFNVGDGRSVYILAPDAQLDTVLLRVTGNNPSRILGQLGLGQFLDGPMGPLSPSQTNLFLVNPQGIIVGPNARLDLAGSLVLSTAPGLDIGQGQWFSAQANGGPALLTVAPDVGVRTDRPIGNLEIQGTIAVGSRQNLSLAGQTVQVSGTLTAPGGRIVLGGDRIALFEASRLLTSAPDGGGSIDLGRPVPWDPTRSGPRSGPHSGPHSSQSIYVAPGAQLAADGTDRGNGGTIRLWSELSTRAYGQFSAQGGPQGGDGGLIDTSGRQFLDVTGLGINATSPLGTPGTWLLDPRNVVLTYGGADGSQFTGDLTRIFTPSSDDARVDIGTIDYFLNQGNNVTIATGDASSPGGQAGNITLAGVDGGWGVTVNSGTARNVTLTLQAANDILLDTPGGFGISATGANRLAIRMEAGNNLQIGGRSEGFGLTTQGGSIALIADRDGNGQGSLSLFRGGLNPGQGAVSLQAGAQILLQRSGVNGLNQTAEAAAPIALSAPSIRLEEAGLNGNTKGSGAGAPILIQTQQLSLGPRPGGTAGSGINTRSFGSGRAGDIVIGDRGGQSIAPAPAIAPAQAIRLQNSGIGSFTGPDTGPDTSLSTTIGRAGDIQLQANQIRLQGSGISNKSRSAGNAGNITLTTQDLQVLDSSGIENTVRSRGQGGNVTIAAEGGQVLVRNSGISLRTIGGSGNSGELSLRADRLRLDQAGGLDSNAGYDDRFTARTYAPETRGNAGTITVTVNSLQARNGSGIRSETAGQGNAGNINLTVRDDLLLQNNGNISTGTFQGSTGQGGTIIARIGSAVIGNDREFRPDNRDSILDPTNRSGGFSSASLGTGNAGNIDLAVRGQLRLQNAPNILPKDRAGIRLYTQQTGRGGSLQLEAAETRIDNGFISVASQSTGAAGDIVLRGSRLSLDNQSQINGNAASVDGGNLDLQLESLVLMRRGSVISTNAGTDRAGGNGGRIAIRSPFVLSVPDENTDIIANAFTGSGGQVNITAQTILGFVPRSRQTLQQLRPRDLDPRQLPSNDISASSQFGEGGSLNLAGIDVNPAKGTTQLPSNTAIAQPIEGCQPNNPISQTEFFTTGRGGFAPSPLDALSYSEIVDDLRIPGWTVVRTNPVAQIESAPFIPWSIGLDDRLRLLATETNRITHCKLYESDEKVPRN